MRHPDIRQSKEFEATLETLFSALTGNGQDGDVQKALDAGFDVHLVKPLDLKQLAEMIASASPRNNHPGSGPSEVFKARMRDAADGTVGHVGEAIHPD